MASEARDAFRENLSRHHSVTEALAEWCAARGLGAGPIRAERLAAHDRAPAPEALRLAPGEAAIHRRIRLMRGEVALAEAENVYVPGRLPDCVARALDETDTPFFTLLAPHGFARRPLGHRLAPGGRFVLETRALVALQGRPVALVRELYEPALLATAAP